MTFDDWWKIKALQLEIPRNVSFYPLIKSVALSAWDAGSNEGCQKTLSVPRDHKPHRDKEG